MRGLFVTGTDTDVGKTWICCLIARQLIASGTPTGVYKPACSGSERDAASRVFWPDIDALAAATGNRYPAERICPQRFHAPLAPNVAAKRESTRVDSQLLRDGCNWWRDQAEVLLVEGVGGLLCPLTNDELVADLAVSLRFPLIVVARASLGTINHTLLTLEAASRRSLQVAAIVLNQESESSIDPAGVALNAQQIRAFSGLSAIGYCSPNSEELVDAETGESLDWDWFSLGRCAE